MTASTTKTPACAAAPSATAVARLDRAAVAGLGLAGFVLSLDALRQMAAASHVRPTLTWLFPLIIDGFIAYSVRALLVLRSAPLPARAYVWCLLATETGVSIWANVLHAVVLNQHAFSSAPTAHGTSGAGLELGDDVVGVLAACAPLALAAAVHLHTLIARHTAPATAAAPTPDAASASVAPSEPDPARLVATRRVPGQGRDDSSARDESTRHHHSIRTSPDQVRDESQRVVPHHGPPATGHPGPQSGPRDRTDGGKTRNPHTEAYSGPHVNPEADPDSPEPEFAGNTDTDHPAAPPAEPPVAPVTPPPRRGRRPAADLDTLTAIGRAATTGQGKPVTRNSVQTAIRDQGLTIAVARLAEVVRRLKNTTADNALGGSAAPAAPETARPAS